MNIQHHISEDTLLAYSAGNLSEAWGLMVATHLALCPSCRARAHEAESIGGALLDALAPAGTSDDSAFAALMQSIDDMPIEVAQPTVRAAPSVLPEPLRSYVGGDLYALRWKRLGMGVYHLPIKTRDGKASARLLKVPAGRPVPLHSHTGEEMTLVLVGSFHTYQGNFQRGDIETADASVEHMPIAAPGEDCICLAVTDSPLRFRSLAARIVQPFIGI
ncbi:MAG: ChrR family anti-sigma-E factor [Parvibaculum sp.]|nr:ChrR family anti-sigma-E factor [Parvibaculum sp.]|tara:strand:- start:4893 stop:5546 length:654 start_codon:yes stop_codon:yes gene_type:complete